MTKDNLQNSQAGPHNPDEPLALPDTTPETVVNGEINKLRAVIKKFGRILDSLNEYLSPRSRVIDNIDWEVANALGYLDEPVADQRTFIQQVLKEKRTACKMISCAEPEGLYNQRVFFWMNKTYPIACLGTGGKTLIFEKHRTSQSNNQTYIIREQRPTFLKTYQEYANKVISSEHQISNQQLLFLDHFTACDKQNYCFRTLYALDTADGNIWLIATCFGSVNYSDREWEIIPPGEEEFVSKDNTTGETFGAVRRISFKEMLKNIVFPSREHDHLGVRWHGNF